MAAAAVYLRSVNERKNSSCINSTFDIFSFYQIYVICFIYLLQKKKLKKSQRLFMILLLPSEYRLVPISYHL
jgi:hypothetical protein